MKDERVSGFERSPLAFRQAGAVVRAPSAGDPFHVLSRIRELGPTANPMPPLPPTSGEHLTDAEVADAILAGRYAREACSCHDRLLELCGQALARIEALERTAAKSCERAGYTLPPSILAVDLRSVVDQHAAGKCPREDGQ